MRSIISEIEQAEAKAEEIRQNAASQAREQIAQAKAKAEDARGSLIERERKKTEAAVIEANGRGTEQARQRLGEMAAEADALCARARGRLDQATAYLVEKAKTLQ